MRYDFIIIIGIIQFYRGPTEIVNLPGRHFYYLHPFDFQNNALFEIGIRSFAELFYLRINNAMRLLMSAFRCRCLLKL